MTQSELEKMLAGELYFASDPDLVLARKHARAITRAYNATTEAEIELRAALLADLFGSVGAGVEIEPSFQCDYGPNIRIGDKVFMNFGCVILDCGLVTIGSNVLFGPGVHIYSATHPTDPEVRRSGGELALPVTIGDDTWLGGRTVICPGVSVGSRSSIGAGSVVVRDIPAGVVAAGNPCRVLREL